MTETKPAIVFQTEPLIWGFLKRGEKTWDARLWDASDDRMYRLMWFEAVPGMREQLQAESGNSMNGRKPVERAVSFRNLQTGAPLTFQYVGLEFPRWAPGWGMILLGKRLP